MKSTNPIERGRLVKRYADLQAKAKTLYRAMDETLEAVLQCTRPGTLIPTSDGRRFLLTDQFKGKNSAWKAAHFRHLDLIEVTQEEKKRQPEADQTTTAKTKPHQNKKHHAHRPETVTH